MIPPYITGLLFGLVFIFSFGPAFFSLIQTSVQKGYKRAICLAIGISLSDIIYVAFALLGVASLLQKPTTKIWMGVIGAAVLLSYSIYTWYKKPTIDTAEEQQVLNSDLSTLKYIAKGFVLNGLNPFIVVFWLGIIGLVATNYDFTDNQEVYFFAGVLTTILTSDIIKVFVAYRLRSFVTPKRIKIINRVVAAVLAAFAIQMVFFLIKNYW